MERPASQGGAYGVQVLIAGRQKHWRDEVASQIRRAGYATTTVDCGVDAMTVLALGLPVDVLVTDISLKGELCCDKLVSEARALRPDLRIVFASDLAQQDSGDLSRLVPDDAFLAAGPRRSREEGQGATEPCRVFQGKGASERESEDAVATVVREALRAPV